MPFATILRCVAASNNNHPKVVTVVAVRAGFRTLFILFLTCFHLKIFAAVLLSCYSWTKVRHFSRNFWDFGGKPQRRLFSFLVLLVQDGRQTRARLSRVLIGCCVCILCDGDRWTVLIGPLEERRSEEDGEKRTGQIVILVFIS